MPEGHTLHRLAAELTTNFAGQRVRVASPQGRFSLEAERLDGSVLVGAEAWGKHLFINFGDDRYVHIHLGLYGKFDINTHDGHPPQPVGQVRLRLVGSQAYADLRGATVCTLRREGEVDAVVAKQGPDPLRVDADADAMVARIRRSKSPIAGLLMDQSVLAGVGNVYRAEVLFRHRVDPFRPGTSMRAGKVRDMWDDLVELMAEGVRTGRIDTVRPEHTPESMGREPRVDDHGGEVYVYRRHGQQCLVCGRAVRTTELQGRNLFWCTKCQPKFRSQAR